MVAATQPRQVRERRRPALGPVAEMVPLGDPDPAPREAAVAVLALERAPQGGGNRPGPRPDLPQAAVGVVPHHHPARVTREPPGRLRGNARPTPEDRLTGLL